MSENETKNKYEVGEIVFDITKLNKMITRPEAKNSKIIIPEYDRDGNKLPDRYAILTLSAIEIDKELYSITPFDLVLLDTVYSMAQNNTEKELTFTIEELANRLVKREVKFESTKMQVPPQYWDRFCLPFLTPEENPDTPIERLNFYNYLHFCVSKLSFIEATIDCTFLKGPRDDIKPDENHVPYLKDILFGPLLPVKGRLYRTIAMKEDRISYTMSHMPILFEYATRYRRVARGPAKLMATPLRATPENITLQNAVAKRVMQIRNQNNNCTNGRLSYEWGRNGEKGLLARVGIRRENFSSDDNWSKKKTKVHRAVGKILEKYKKENLIKDYQEVKNGKTYVGYDIVV